MHLVLLCSADVPGKACPFLKGNGEAEDQGDKGGGLGRRSGQEGREGRLRLGCMKE